MTVLPHQNPYIIGCPIREPDKIFGREDLFNMIANNLSTSVQLTVLYGQRRIGKSSVLQQIPNRINDEQFIFIKFDFQKESRSSNSHILSEIAHEILNVIKVRDNQCFNLVQNIKKDFQSFSSEFIPRVCECIGDRKIVFIWDEFDVFTTRNNDQETQEFCQYILNLLNQNNNLFLITVLGTHIKLSTSLSFLQQESYTEICLLDAENTKSLITKTAQGILTYQPETINAIFNLSAGSPYFTQVICSTIYNEVSSNRYGENPNDDLPTITPQNVTSVIDRAMTTAQGGLDGLWKGFNWQQKIIMAAAAEAQEIAMTNNQSVIETPLTLLTNQYSREITQDLTDAYKQLCEYGFLHKTEQYVKIKIEFVRLWLVKEHSLKDEIKNVPNNT
jgi:hypothetical protein